jgi:hypothetical protein
MLSESEFLSGVEDNTGFRSEGIGEIRSYFQPEKLVPARIAFWIRRR